MAEYTNVPKDPYKSYPGTRYTELSPKDKRTHLDLITEGLDYDWQMQDDILQNEKREREAWDLFEKAGATFTAGELDTSKVIGKEKEEMMDRASAILQNLEAIQGHTEFKEKGWDDHWLKRSGRWADEALGDFGDWITDPYGARHDIPNIPGAIGDMEWDKILKNAVINTPEMLKDLATFGPQLGWNVGKMIQGDDIENPMEFLSNKPYFDYEKPDTAERVTEESLSALGSIPLYRWLYNKMPNMAQKVARNWMPFMHGLSQKAPPAHWLKNLVWSPGTARGLGQTALTGGLGAFASTLLYSTPLNAGEANMFQEPAWEPWMEHSTSRFDLDNPNEMRNAAPMASSALYTGAAEPIERREERGPGPWNEFRG